MLHTYHMLNYLIIYDMDVLWEVSTIYVESSLRWFRTRPCSSKIGLFGGIIKSYFWPRSSTLHKISGSFICFSVLDLNSESFGFFNSKVTYVRIQQCSRTVRVGSIWPCSRRTISRFRESLTCLFSFGSVVSIFSSVFSSCCFSPCLIWSFSCSGILCNE